MLTRSCHHVDHPRPPHRALPRVRQRLQDGVRRCPGRPPRPRPRPRPPRLRGAQELLRLCQARVLLGVAWRGVARSGGTAVGPMHSRRLVPFHETTCTRGRRQAIQEIFSRPQMLGKGPCRINSLCGRCIEVFSFCRCRQPRMWSSSLPGELCLARTGLLDYQLLMGLEGLWEAVGSVRPCAGIPFCGLSDGAVGQCPWLRAKRGRARSPEGLPRACPARVQEPGAPRPRLRRRGAK